MSKRNKTGRKSELDQLEKIKKWAVVAMFSDDYLMERLVLKGGNAISIGYGIGNRASIDLDFSMKDEIPIDEFELFKGKITQTLKKKFKKHNLVVFDVNVEEKPRNLTADMADFWGGYKVDFKVIGKEDYNNFKDNLNSLRKRAIMIGQNARFFIDISKFEYIETKESKDLDDFCIFLYSPEMLVAEKLRAICQQMPEYSKIVKRDENSSSARARDFFDIYTVIEHFELNITSHEGRSVIKHCFDAKKVPFEFLADIVNFREFHRLDFESVKQTVTPVTKLKEFDFYFKYVVDLAQRILSVKHKT